MVRAQNIYSNYFAWSREFDYRKYLEHKSHFDQIEITLDGNAQRVIGSIETVAASIGESSRQMSEGIESNTDRLIISLDQGFGEVSRDIRKLSTLCQVGFKRLETQLVEINQRLAEIIKILSSPEATWAEEQFRSARSCFNRRLWAECFEYLDWALNGNGNHTGYKLNPNIHYFYGVVLLGQANEFPLGRVDLEQAKRRFLDATRYAYGLDKGIYSQSLSRAGFASYCQGDMASCIDLQEKALLVDANLVEAHFMMAKAQICIGEIRSAQESYLRAARLDPLSTVRAANDADFSDPSFGLPSQNERLRLELVERNLDALKQIKLERILAAARVAEEETTDARMISRALNELDRNVKILPILELVIFRDRHVLPVASRMSHVLQSTHERLASTVSQVGDKKSAVEGLGSIIAGGCAFLGLGATIVAWISTFFTDGFEAILYVPGVAIAGGLAFFAGGLVGGTIGWLVESALKGAEQERRSRDVDRLQSKIATLVFGQDEVKKLL